MARVHLAAWRSTYAGILPEAYLTTLSAERESLDYERAILQRRGGHAGFVAIADGQEIPGGGVVGFITGGLSRRPGIAEGEVETLYLLDDFRDRGVGRRLMRAMASHLASLGAESAFAWVLEDNPSRWFYARLGAKLVAREALTFAGQRTTQLAYAWEPIHTLLTATATTRLPR
ncbi:GNAT family N-acetyltransferase [Roseococcus sp. SDR]|uniref:GNAT family N-acetyltransferase n=1 Tax=Roseococcus sp. SDR TaxID=2835532 RepID=UPI0020C10910|nr:GNAT family N-acetyltransferase [Roseococcus sp. SDR]